MTIRFANTDDIPQLLNLLRQVEMVHHDIRPDLFRDGGEKYEPETLKELLKDVNRPVLTAVEDGVVVGYAFCVLEETAGDPARLDRKELYLDDLCVDASVRGKGVAKQLWQGLSGIVRDLRFIKFIPRVQRVADVRDGILGEQFAALVVDLKNQTAQGFVALRLPDCGFPLGEFCPARLQIGALVFEC